MKLALRGIPRGGLPAEERSFELGVTYLLGCGLDIETVGVDRDPRVISNVGHPVASTRCSRDDESTIVSKPPDLDASRQPTLPAMGRDVDGLLSSERVELVLSEVHASESTTSTMVEVKGRGLGKALATCHAGRLTRLAPRFSVLALM